MARYMRLRNDSASLVLERLPGRKVRCPVSEVQQVLVSCDCRLSAACSWRLLSCDQGPSLRVTVDRRHCRSVTDHTTRHGPR